MKELIEFCEDLKKTLEKYRTEKVTVELKDGGIVTTVGKEKDIFPLPENKEKITPDFLAGIKAHIVWGFV